MNERERAELTKLKHYLIDLGWSEPEAKSMVSTAYRGGVEAARAFVEIRVQVVDVGKSDIDW